LRTPDTRSSVPSGGSVSRRVEPPGVSPVTCPCDAMSCRAAVLRRPAAAGRFITAARDAIASHGQFIVALSGGSTPRDTYLLLGTEALVPRVMWSRVQVLWGDERCVPPDHIESNYRMARETLLDRVPIPAENVHRVHGEDDP